ncbi:MAG: ABC transporter permease [Opitutaceae bacterium]
MGQDVRYALRQLWRAKGFTTVVVLTLALGIGGTTAIYSVVNTTLFHPVPGPDADRIVQIGEQTYMSRETTLTPIGMSSHVFEAIQARDNTALFTDLAWVDSSGGFERKAGDFVEAVRGSPVSPNFFSVFGARPILGRTFGADEAVPQNIQTRLPERDAPIVLSHAGWQSLFAGEREVLGRVLDLSGRRYTVVGVMPEWFQFPFPSVQFWVPAEPMHLPADHGGGNNMRVLVRLKAGVAVSQLQAMLHTLAAQMSNDPTLAWRWQRTRMPSGLSLWARSLGEMLLGAHYGRGGDDIRQTLFVLLAAIGFVLLIVCANVANLMLARTERRQHELAIRAALGADRLRLTRQLLTESVLLALFGGAGALVVTAWSMKLLIALNTMPRLGPVEVDGRALGITLVVTLLTALAFGLMPAWRGGRPKINATLAQGGSNSTMALGGRFYRRALVVVQVALAMSLLAGAGLMIQSVVRLLHVDPGYDASNLVVSIVTPPDRLRRSDIPPATRAAFYEQLRERLMAVPGVTAVGIWKMGAFDELITLDGREAPMTVYRGGTGVGESDYFRVARVPLLAGRLLERSDIGEKIGTVVINEAMARRCWPGESAIGKRFRTEKFRAKQDAESYEVIGVVGDVRSYSYDEELKPTFFRPHHEAAATGAPVWTVVRTGLDLAAVAPGLRREFAAFEPNMRTPSIWAAEQRLYDATLPRRVYRNYLATFAGVGLLLAALGIYGVLAYSVAQRTREIGIRIALGAAHRQVMGLVMGEGLRMIGLGVALGLVAIYWLMRLLQKQLFGVSPHDPVVLAAVAGVLAIVALIACWLPARRAAKVDPMVALRCE